VTKKRKRSRKGCFPLFSLLILLLVFRLWVDNCTIAVREYGIVSAEIPSGLDGLRIAQISDLHGNERLYGKLLASVRDAAPDLIALTGDLTDAEEQWAALEPLLEELTEIAPCYYVSGNHEWADLEPEPLFRNIAGTGVTVLRNRWAAFSKGDSRLTLLGVEDPNGYADMIQPPALCEAVRAETDEYLIALCHRPDLFPLLSDGGCDLVLSGHNHGGLIRLPFLGGLISTSGWLPEYDRGLFFDGDCVMLVSPGLSGSKGIPRFLNRAEVSVAVLRKNDPGTQE